MNPADSGVTGGRSRPASCSSERRPAVGPQSWAACKPSFRKSDGATQLGIFLGYARGGWWGALLGGACFVLPGFFVMLVLTLAYAALGVTPLMRGALYGLGPVALAIFLVVYRLGRSAASTAPQGLLMAAAALASMFSPLGVAAILLLAGGMGRRRMPTPRGGVTARDGKPGLPHARTGGRDTPERYFLARREALSITATSGNDCAAAAAMGGSHPVAANAIPTRL
jgi:Chromate transporter